MISTKDLSGLPNAERLKNFCKGLAALDIIMLEEEWSFIRHYTYNPAWRKGKEAFFATDGSDRSMIVMFAPEEITNIKSGFEVCFLTILYVSSIATESLLLE